ncbi:PREDICTED: gametogenetin-binding protein 1-like [Condylura cristata]|uniref:gametogenetin-binding protein 1-like n=1 Tax=Condylura cristata TaxID=143302 RepID=UPI000642923F|nr:PREDICTED: gametogenetin-binding protein 1-like [Condylura cristata]
MEDPAPSPPSRSLARSSMFRFFRSLLGSKGSPKSSGKLLEGQQCPSQEQDALPLVPDCQGRGGRKEPWPSRFSLALPQRCPMGLATSQPPMPMKALKVTAQGVEVKSVSPREGQQVLSNLSEEEAHLAQAQAVKQGCLERAMEPWEDSPEAFTTEEEKENLLEGDVRLASLDVEATPWRCLLTLYKQLQKSTTAKFPLKESLTEEEEGEEEETEADDSSFELCDPDTDTFQSLLCKTSGLTDPLRIMESELKKLLVVQQEPYLWKMGDHKDQELLTQPEMIQEEVSLVEGQHLLLEEMDETGRWSAE